MLDLQVFLLVAAGLAEGRKNKWKNFKDFDYLVVGDYFIGFIEAESMCVNRSAHLASIHSKEENDFILNLAPNHSVIGGAHDIPIYNMWIGGYMAQSWQWTDLTDWNYTNWEKREPNNYLALGKCAFMYTRRSHEHKAGKWSDYKCHGELLYYVCKRPANISRSYCPMI
ncbi:unnamed protein product [Cylicocyclus nassatus]|uniref:C-type lectin domain-containing protein n=1 Tax=Cylicocyclus nassatus TaxID=53992 RepID=A0AA36MBS7_CYLNA|nr:unnamed protein product [Cylicocyclus nassatus]